MDRTENKKLKTKDGRKREKVVYGHGPDTICNMEYHSVSPSFFVSVPQIKQ